MTRSDDFGASRRNLAETAEAAERSRIESMVVPARPTTGSAALVDLFVQLGVEHAFGILGGAIAPFCAAVSDSSIQLTTFCHESGAGFAAIELSLATGHPVVVVGTTGPGTTNLLTSMNSARWEGARVIFVTGYTPAEKRGRWPLQETSGATALAELFTPGPVFHYASVIERVSELDVVASRLAVGMSRPNGFVAHLGLPLDLQTATVSRTPRVRFSSMPPPGCNDESIAACVELLGREPFVIWAGFGARGASRQVRELAERAGAHVMCTPRGKGIMPEDHPLYLGVTGLGGHASPEQHFHARRPARTLVLGSRLGELSSFWSEGLIPPEGFVHVDLDPAALGAAYPAVPTLGVIAEIGAFLDAVLDAWPQAGACQPYEPAIRLLECPPLPRAGENVRPSYLMSAIQRVVVDASDAVLFADCGNAIGLMTHYLRFRDGPRFRLSTGFGSMGHAAAGVLGVALASGGKAVAVVGDGAMLMTNEINTAVARRLGTVWVVLNDARYGMVAQGMEALGWTPFGTDFPRVDFAAVARGLGADGVRVASEADVDAALATAMAAPGPFVVDVIVDPDERVPSGRNASLRAQGVDSALAKGRPPLL
jgi:acetolactate synthase-1/2/3 large subunit